MSKPSEPRELNILLVEDNPGDARLIREHLSEAGDSDLHLAFAESLADGLRQLQEGHFDVVLLDLGLPDSQGLDTLERMLHEVPDVPVIVLTGLEGEESGVRALQAGAQDYLSKGWVNGLLIARAVRYAVERHRLQNELRRVRQREEQEREWRSLDELSSPVQTSITAQFFGSPPLSEALPETFGELVDRYGRLLELALEERTFRIDHNTSEELRAISEQLGLLNAGPRDVVTIHKVALKGKAVKATSQKIQAYIEEGRLTVLELMGHLVSVYRNRSLWTQNSVSKRNNEAPFAGEGD